MNFDELDRRLRVFETAHDMNIIECCMIGTLENSSATGPASL